MSPGSSQTLTAEIAPLEPEEEELAVRKVIPHHDSGSGLLKCDQCQGAFIVEVDNQGEAPSQLVRCACGMMYDVIIEWRRHPRVPTQLQGSYVNLSKPGQEGDMVVEDLSLGGVRFRPLEPYAITRDDHLHIVFVLDDEHQTFIWQKIQVRHTRDGQVGAEFIEEGSSKQALAAFLYVRNEIASYQPSCDAP